MRYQNLKTYKIDINEEDLQYILESLIFSSCVDITTDWKEKDNKNIIDLAKKIKDKTNIKLKLSNIKLYGIKNFEDPKIVKLVKKILK